MGSKSVPLQGQIDGRLIRGGTSKGFFVRDAELSGVPDGVLDEFVLELFGSPDPLQVDGIGGSHSHTSKLMIVGPSNRDGIDVDYTFGQVGITQPVVDWSGNCGNLTSAVGTFAMKEGFVDPGADPAALTLYNTNTDTVVEQTVPLLDGEPTMYGEYEINGVPGTGARIDSTFLDPSGGVFGSLTPTGAFRETVSVRGEDFEVSLIDVTNPCVFVRASDLALTGTELPAELSDSNVLDTLELIRGAVCERLGLVNRAADAATESPTTPFIAMVSAPQSYECTTDTSVSAADIDITGRIITSQSAHHAYAMTGAMCLAAATRLEDTIPHEVARRGANPVRIGHPKGTISVSVDASDSTVHSVTVGRTAREIMHGTAFYRYVDGLAQLAPDSE